MLKFWKLLNGLYERLLILLFVLVFLVGLWQMYDNYYMFNHASDRSFLRYKPGSTAAETVRSSPISDEMIGWLTIDGTSIDFPVMQAADNSKYLSTDVFGNYSMTGSIFLDSRNSPDFSDSFSMIYGHHMEYGKMFGALDDFLNDAYLHAHATGTLMLGRDGSVQYPLEVLAGLRVSVRERSVFDLDQKEAREYLSAQTGIDLSARGEPLVALSTCQEASSLSRIVVLCCLKQSES
ncbi:MAG: class B sortase [Oscillospiraceae bacterium]|nr:class B sortase [Oscillospiraceae bacterium]